MKPYPPLATLLVAAAVRQQGHDVRFFDAMLAQGVEDFEATLDTTAPRIVLLVEDNFNFLTKMCTLRMREAALHMIRAAAARGCTVFVNGSDAADNCEIYLGAGADAVMLGEPDESTLELTAACARGDFDYSTIAGLALLTPTGVRRTAARPVLKTLDALPFPAWDLVDFGLYRAAWRTAHGRFSLNLVASRGCPYGCNWCAKPLFGRGYAQRAPALVAQEMAELRQRAQPDHIWFADDIFGLSAAWIERFAAEVQASGGRTPFTIQSRVNLMAAPKTVAALRTAGLEEVWLGVESGSQKVLDAMDKGTRIMQVKSATDTLRAHGARVCWFIQLGYLGEEWEDIEATRELIRACRPDDIGVSVAYPLPGTKFYEKVRAHLGAQRNWVDTDDLAVLFPGAYSTELYRKVRDLLHDEVRANGDARNPGIDLAWTELAASRTGMQRQASPAVIG